MRWLNGLIDSKDVSWANSGRWWRTGKPGMLQSMGSQRVGHDLEITNNNNINALRLKKFGCEQDLANCFDLLKMGRVRVGVVMRSACKGLGILNWGIWTWLCRQGRTEIYEVVCEYFQPIWSNRQHQIYPTILNKWKLYKIYETMTFRHWTTADAEQSFLRNEISMNWALQLPQLLLGGNSRAGLRVQDWEFRELTGWSSVKEALHRVDGAALKAEYCRKDAEISRGFPLKSPLEYWSLHVRGEITLAGKRTSEKAKQSWRSHSARDSLLSCKPEWTNPSSRVLRRYCLWSRESQP